MWPFQVGSDGLSRALAGIGILAFCVVLRDVAIVVYCGRSHEMLRFPPRREFRPRFTRRSRRDRRRDRDPRRRPLGLADKVALGAGVAVGSVVLIAVGFVVALAALFLAFVALGAVGWFLGPVVAAVVWLLVAFLSVAVPVTRSGDRAAALGRLYRSARYTLTRPAFVTDVVLPSPLWPLISWADRMVMPRVDISSGAAPWADGPGPRRRNPRWAGSGGRGASCNPVPGLSPRSVGKGSVTDMAD